MKLSNRIASFAVSAAWLTGIALLSGCAKTSDSTNATQQLTVSVPNGSTLPSVSGLNVLSLSVNGSNCASGSYANKPCVQIKVCAHGDTSNCATISDILLDTGSSGLRVFKSVLGNTLSSALTPVASGGGSVAECVQYGDGSSDWGTVANADIYLGGEPLVNSSIQIIDSTYATLPSACSGADTDPQSAGYNGILGVGLFAQDCGLDCASTANNGIYFSCSGSSCSGAKVPVASQVTNPVSLLPVDHNGVILEFPSVPTGGVAAAEGYLVLGIGTRSNNAASGVNLYQADSGTGEFAATFKGQNYTSFIDSGSNAMFFPTANDGNLVDCTQYDKSLAGFYCPQSLDTLSVTTSGVSGSTSGSVAFQIGNALNLFSSSNNVFAELGADGTIGGSEVFDLGMPFHLGRNIYVGIEGGTSSLGQGTYWAY